MFPKLTFDYLFYPMKVSTVPLTDSMPISPEVLMNQGTIPAVCRSQGEMPSLYTALKGEFPSCFVSSSLIQFL